MTGGIFSLNTAFAPRLVRIAYILALIIIVLSMIIHVAQGVIRMTHPVTHHARATMAVGSRQGQLSGPGQGALPQATPNIKVFRHAPRHLARRRFPLLRIVPRNDRAEVIGVFWIIRALIVGGMAILLVRILAEIANALLLSRSAPPRE